MNIKSIIKAVRDILFPKAFTCDICGVETFGDNLCNDCKKTVTFNNGVTCPECGRKTVRPEICIDCKAKPPLFKRGFSALVYEDGAQILLQKFKNGSPYLKEYFADLITAKPLPEADAIVFAPMTKRDMRKRGYNQSKLLAKSISARTGVPVVSALEKAKKTKAQKSLGFNERKNNLEGSFKVTDAELVKDKKLLLVDDIMTTGATADAIVLALLDAGSKAVNLATAASVEHRIIKTRNASNIKNRVANN